MLPSCWPGEQLKTVNMHTSHSKESCQPLGLDASPWWVVLEGSGLVGNGVEKRCISPSLNQMIGEAPKELLKQSDDLQEEEINILILAA